MYWCIKCDPFMFRETLIRSYQTVEFCGHHCKLMSVDMLFTPETNRDQRHVAFISLKGSVHLTLIYTMYKCVLKTLAVLKQSWTIEDIVLSRNRLSLLTIHLNNRWNTCSITHTTCTNNKTWRFWMWCMTPFQHFRSIQTTQSIMSGTWARCLLRTAYNSSG